MSTAINWRDNWSAALEEAKQTNRPLVLEFYMEGCPHCHRLVRETHADDKVAAALNDRFIPVRLEGRGQMELVQKLGVRGAPTTLVFSSDGQEKHRFVGFQAPEDYLKELDKAA